jgi:purine-binding chemotaxis protein CheW
MTKVAVERRVDAPVAPLPDAAPTTRVASAATAMPTEFLTFRPGGEEYGIDIQRVQ